jgi:hypothetical protein
MDLFTEQHRCHPAAASHASDFSISSRQTRKKLAKLPVTLSLPEIIASAVGQICHAQN